MKAPLHADGRGRDATVTVTGKLADLNAALEGLGFTPEANHEGAAQLTIILNDGGASGSGGALQTQAIVPINVLPQNDRPQVSEIGAQTTGDFIDRQFLGLSASLVGQDFLKIFTANLAI